MRKERIKNKAVSVFPTVLTGIAVVIVQTVLFCACSNSGSPSSKTASGTTDQSSSMISAAYSSSNTSNVSTQSASNAGASTQSATNSGETIVSGTLRLWMQTPATLHPLVSNAYQWVQLSHLFYEGLYETDSNQNAVPCLADGEHSVSADGLTYRIQLKGNIYFHDNTVFDAQDVVSTMQFIQNPANKSIYYNNLRNVQSVSFYETKSVMIVLKQPDPFFLYELTFPVLTSEHVADLALQYQPGTGEYKMQSYEKGKQMNAVLFQNHRIGAKNLIKKIKILELKDTRTAMEAFDNDEVDMVILRDLNYESYYLRNDIKMIRYPSGNYLFYEMNRNGGRILQDKNKADYMKSVLQKNSLKDGITGIFTTADRFPFLSSSPLLHVGQCKDLLSIPVGENPFLKESRTLEIIYPLHDLVKEKLAGKVNELLTKEKIPCRVTGYEPAKYALAVKSGNYDIALREAQITQNPDPSWMYLLSSVRSVPGSETILKTADERYSTVLTELSAKFTKPGTKINADEFCGIMNRVDRYSPVVGIGFRISGVMISKRIQGQLESNEFNKYNNVKDVWVWSGQ